MSLQPLALNDPSLQPVHQGREGDHSNMLDVAAGHLERGDPASALDILRRLVQLEPESGQAWVSLARSYYLLGDYETSFATYQRALSTKKEGNCEAQLWYGIGLLSARVKDYDNAISMLKTVLRVDPKFKESGEVWLELGKIYKEMENWQEAVRALQQCVGMVASAKLCKAYTLLGQCQVELNDTEMATSSFQKALETDPTSTSCLLHLSWLQRRHKDISLSTLRQVKPVSPKETALLHYIQGRIFYLHRVSTANDDLRTAYTIEPNNAVYLTSMAIAAYEAKDWTLCQPLLEKTAELMPEHGLVWYNFGLFFEAKDRKIDAKRAYEKVVELDKECVKEAKSRLEVMGSKSLPDMLHPGFEIEENGPVIRFRPPESRLPERENKLKTPVFKVTRAEHVASKPAPVKRKKRGKTETVQPHVPQNNMGMYSMIPFFCVPPEMEGGKTGNGGYPGYFPGQMIYYPCMVPYYMPTQDVQAAETEVPKPTPPAIQVEAPTAPIAPDTPSSSLSDTAHPPIDLDDLISHSSEQDKEPSDGEDSLDGLHISGRRSASEESSE